MTRSTLWEHTCSLRSSITSRLPPMQICNITIFASDAERKRSHHEPRDAPTTFDHLHSFDVANNDHHQICENVATTLIFILQPATPTPSNTRPHLHLETQQNPNRGKRNLIWEKEYSNTWQSLNGHWNGQNWSKLVKAINSGQILVKVSQTKGVKLQIWIFLDVSAILDYQIWKWLI